MCGIIFRYGLKLVPVIYLLVTSTSLSGQNNEIVRSLKLTIGGGYGHYFNTFTNVLDQDIKNNRPSFYGKIMWQPEHRLRIGIESGYYKLYSTTRVQTDNGSDKLTTDLSAIPVFFSFSMKTTKHLDVNFATGGALMNYSVIVNKSKKDKVTGQTFSMSNFAAGLTWYIPLGKRIELGTELKYLFIGKTNDNHLSAFLNFSYKIINRNIK